MLMVLWTSACVVVAEVLSCMITMASSLSGLVIFSLPLAPPSWPNYQCISLFFQNQCRRQFCQCTQLQRCTVVIGRRRKSLVALAQDIGIRKPVTACDCKPEVQDISRLTRVTKHDFTRQRKETLHDIVEIHGKFLISSRLPRKSTGRKCTKKEKIYFDIRKLEP